MAHSVLLQCGLRPLSAGDLPRQTSRLPSNAGPFFLPVPLPGSTQRGRFGRPVRLGGDWTLRMSAPVRVAAAGAVEGEDEKKRRLWGGDVSNGRDGEGEFDPGAPPPFGLAEIRAAIPKHCWEKDPWRSAGYVVRDVAAVLGLAAAAAHLDSWVVWPLYWLAQGIMFFALFIIGHDCGHGSFSNNEKLNSVLGHFLHSSVLVPYHGWRISHRTHHQNHGHIEKDEGWHPLTEAMYKSLDPPFRFLWFSLPFPMLVFPLYLFLGSIRREGSHFHPGSDLFRPNERRDVLTSTACWTAMVGLLAGLTWLMGPMQMLKLYFMPYFIFVMWLDLVTYLHHHGHEEKRPWYRGKEWSYLRGGLSTLDRDYGWINNIHHDIGTHVIHHLFPQIPHYHVVEATEAARPVLGKYYKEPEKSGPLPLHLFRELARSMERDHFVSDTGDVVYYQKGSELNRSGTSGGYVE